MKIALCFSGQARSVEKGFEYYQRNLLSRYDVDVFVHSWVGPHSRTIINLYKPTLFSFDAPLTGDFDQRYPRTPDRNRHPPRATVNMFFSVHKACALKRQHEAKTGVVYDWVVRSRLDYALNCVIEFAPLNPNKLYVPNERQTTARDFCNDQFAYGSSRVMDKYCDTYNGIDQFYNAGASMIGESMLQANLKKNGLVGNNMIYVDMKNPFSPGPFNGTRHSLIRDDIAQWKDA